MVSDTRFALHCKSIFFDLFWAKVALFYCHFLISCWVSFVLRCFYKGYSSFLCCGENCKTFCLAEHWTCINMRCGLKILDLNACHILPLQIQLSGSFELKLQNVTLVVVPFRRIKKTNEQSLHWSFRFIEISPLAPSTQSKIQKIKLIILVSRTRPLKFTSAPRKAKHFIGQWIMTADDSIKIWFQNLMSVHELRHDRPSGRFSKSRGLSASVSFLSSPPPPRSFTCAIFCAAVDSHSSFFAQRQNRNACYAGYENVKRARGLMR